MAKSKQQMANEAAGPTGAMGMSDPPGTIGVTGERGAEGLPGGNYAPLPMVPQSGPLPYVRIRRKVEVRLSQPREVALAGLVAGLDKAQAKTIEGLRVTSRPQALLWLLDRLAAGELVLVERGT